MEEIDSKKEIMSIHESLEELISEEKIVIDKILLINPLCYNLAEGGWGGYTDISKRVYIGNPESNKKISDSKIGKCRPDLVERHKNDETFKYFWRGVKRSDADKEKKSISLKSAISEGRHAGFGEFTCPKCGKVGKSMNNMKRWHFDNCRIGE